MRRFLTAVFTLAFASILFAQTPPDVITGAGNFSPIVADLDRSLAFYHDAFGLDVPGPAVAGPRPFQVDASLLNFLGVPTAQIRFATVRIPGSTMGIEIVDFKDIDRKPVQPRLQDPGAVRLILLVRDIDAMFARLKSAKVPVVTVGGAPLNRAVIVKDPDGFFIQIMQPDPLPETTAPAASNIIGARFGLTIADTDKTIRVYRDLLGFQPQTEAAFRTDKPLNDLMNTPGAQIRRSTARVPGSAVDWELLEFKGIDRKPIGTRIQDPGATRFQLRVRDADATVKTLTTAGGTVITTGGDGGPITMRNLRVALVRELNNLFLVVMK